VERSALLVLEGLHVEMRWHLPQEGLEGVRKGLMPVAKQPKPSLRSGGCALHRPATDVNGMRFVLRKRMPKVIPRGIEPQWRLRWGSGNPYEGTWQRVRFRLPRVGGGREKIVFHGFELS
jgi:hypothetical protein